MSLTSARTKTAELETTFPHAAIRGTPKLEGIAMIRFVLFAILAVTVSLAGERTASAQKPADPKTALKAKVTMSFKGNAPISELLTTISKN